MKSVMKLAIALLGAMNITVAIAQPVQLTEVEFEQRIAGLPSVTETFNALPLGVLPSPLQLSNGSFVGTPQIMTGLWCVLSACLTVGLSADGEFTQFPANTAFWSGRVIVAAAGNVIEARVVGNSGTQSFVQPPMAWNQAGVFLGFHDPRGLRSVSFRVVQGGVNYSIDDVRIATQAGPPAASAVPANSVASTMTLGILLLTFGLMAAGQLDPRRA